MGEQRGDARRREWDVALSYASTQRRYVRKVAKELQRLGISCFYDEGEATWLLGKRLSEELAAIYGERSGTVVIFFSAEYAERDWTRWERRSALRRAVDLKREYILPGYFDDTPLPPPLDDIASVDLRRHRPKAFAKIIADKLHELDLRPPLPADTATEASYWLRRWRVRLAAIGLPATAAIAALLLFVTGAFNSNLPRKSGPIPATTTPAPTVTPGQVLDWSKLPPFASHGDTLYGQSLTKPAPGWPLTKSRTRSAVFARAGYEVRQNDTGQELLIAAPTSASADDEVVSATATLDAGQGTWGVWCRGTDKSGTDSYEFLISHTAAVGIRNGKSAAIDFHHLNGVDVSKPVTLSGRCADVGNTGVELTLAVNGRTALTLRPQGTLLGPGYAGVVVSPFKDVAGPTALITFTRFSIIKQ